MAYKNFLLRVIFSFIFISIYLIIAILNFSLVYYLVFFIYFFIFLEVYFNFNQSKFTVLLYILISLFFFVLLNFDQENFLFFNLYIFIVVNFDIFSYFTGKLFGKNKFIKISPNKTIEGLFGGILLSFVLSAIFAVTTDISINFHLLLFIFLIIFSSFVGDLIESYFKRKNNIKNSSEFLPGHGGVFDRFDSFLFSIIFYSIFVNYILWILIFMEAQEK